METTLAEFLMGMFAGAVTGLLAVLTRTTNRVSRRFSKRRAQTIRRRKSKARGARRNNSGSRGNTLKPRARIVDAVQDTEGPLTLAAPVQTVASCPACGLEAPESLLAEHFLGSPSHENPQAHPEEEEPVEGPAQPVKVEDSQGALRTLLQMLVPPRAFGHRRQQKTQNPLSDYVTPIDAVRKLSTNPLLDPL